MTQTQSYDQRSQAAHLSVDSTEADDLSITTEESDTAGACSASKACPDQGGNPQWCFDCTYTDNKPNSITEAEWESFSKLIGDSCAGDAKGFCLAGGVSFCQ